MLLCDHTYRFTHAAQAIQSVIAEGGLGELIGFASVRTNAQCGHSDVDVFWDLAHHDLSLIDAFFGGMEPDDVVADVAASTGRRARRHRHAQPLVTVRSQRTNRRGLGRRGEAPRDRSARHGGSLRWDDLAAEPLTGSDDVAAPTLAPATAGQEPLRAVVREFLEVVRGERAPRCGTDVDLRVLATLERATAFVAGSV